MMLGVQFDEFHLRVHKKKEAKMTCGAIVAKKQFGYKTDETNYRELSR